MRHRAGLQRAGWCCAAAAVVRVHERLLVLPLALLLPVLRSPVATVAIFLLVLSLPVAGVTIARC